MSVTGATIRSALAAVGAVGKQLRGFDELAAGADVALRQAPPGLTAFGAASFLATLGQESDYFRATEEYAKNGRYAPFIGRTFEMITWQGNYQHFGDWCHAHGLLGDPGAFVHDPRSLADYRWAWLGGVWFFEANGLWRYANAGDHWSVSQAVNGGNGRIGTSFTPNGWAARRRMFDAFRAAGDSLLPTRIAPQEDDMPTVDQMWGRTIPDFYTDDQHDGMPADIALGWVTSHAAHANDNAAAALKAVQELTDALRAKGVI